MRNPYLERILAGLQLLASATFNFICQLFVFRKRKAAERYFSEMCSLLKVTIEENEIRFKSHHDKNILIIGIKYNDLHINSNIMIQFSALYGFDRYYTEEFIAEMVLKHFGYKVKYTTVLWDDISMLKNQLFPAALHLINKHYYLFNMKSI